VTVLLDESVPRLIKIRLPQFAIKTMQEMGWTGIKNGDLIKHADDQFDAFITADKNLRYQQNLAERKLAVILLPTNRVPDVIALLPAIELSLKTAKPGAFVEIPGPVKKR
jgi:hypothetical protein